MINFPPAFTAADTASLEGQQRFIRSVRLQLFLLLIAGAASALTVASGDLNVTALIAGCAFLGAAGLRLRSFSGLPHRRWYEGRAAAESIKTLAWRYAAGGEPFPISAGDAQASATMAAQIDDITSDLSSLSLSSRPEEEATSPMRALRRSDLPSRKDAYLRDRIQDQQSWYAAKARWNRSRERMWSRVVLAAEALGALGAFLVGFDVIDLDLFGLAGALAAVSAAWLETKQHHSIANAYGVAASELSAILELGKRDMNEEEWARFVAQSEEAISREHTLWRARISKD